MVVSGSGHAIDAKVAVTLQSDAWITISGSSDSLSIAGGISNGTAAHGIVKNGLGTLILSGSDTYTGGTTVNGGILEIETADALPAGQAVTINAGGTLIFNPAAADAPAAPANSAITPAPEPGTLALLVAALTVLLLCAIRRRFWAQDAMPGGRSPGACFPPAEERPLW